MGEDPSDTDSIKVVCMYVYMHVCILEWARIHQGMHVCMYVCMYVCKHLSEHGLVKVHHDREGGVHGLVVR